MSDRGVSWAELWDSIWKKGIAMLTQPTDGIGVIVPLGSGYSKEADQMERAQMLSMLCSSVVINPEYQAHDITGDGIAETFCNRATREVMEGMGYTLLPPKINANQLCAHFEARPEVWREVDFQEAAKLAQRGALVVLGAVWEPHGHVTAVAPEPAQMSGSWGEEVPLCAHVGGGKTPNGIVKASAAFTAAQRPTLRAWAWEASIV